MIEDTVGERARDALDRHEWAEAYELLSTADATGELGPGELDLLAQASWWTGRLPAGIEARERAHAGFVKAGNAVMAALEAGLIAQEELTQGNHAVASAWLNRAERHLAGAEETPVNGWISAVRAFQASLDGRYDAALDASVQARGIAERFGDRDLGALALSCEGLSRIHLGDVERGLAMVDEATVAAVGGELDAQVAGGVCCSTIEACAALGDWGRAEQWTEAQDRWCRREHINGFPGMCRVFRAEIKRVQGDWLAAESEARRATEELADFIPAAVGLALYEIGVIRLRRGDLPAAEDALTQAHEHGRDPEPAWSQLLLAKGQVEVAAASIRRALEDPDQRPSWWAHPASDLNRLVLLPVQAEVALAAGDLATARAATDSLTSLAERFPSPQSRALAAATHGSTLVAEGQIADGIRTLRRAIELWAAMNAPYEAAQSRVALAAGFVADGAAERGRRELEAARAAFERLGAAPDVRRVDALLGEAGDPSASPGIASRASAKRTVVRTFVFTDIVDSTRLNELLGDDAWQAMIRWHDQAIRSVVARHGGEEVKSIGDGFFLAFPDVDAALAASVEVQRAFEEHRRREGFAPALRIGVHQAPATRAGVDYLGAGVNQAARVASAATGGEVLATAATVVAARRGLPETGRRTVGLKGIAEPVEVVSIDWR